jgi:pimeloyl-ACP methyl ester carboxylesterase
MTLPKLAASLLTFAAIAVTLAGCGALVGQRSESRAQSAEARYPPTGQFIEVAGRRVHAHVEGSGPDLILLHGASGSTRDFTFSLVDQLKDRYRVIAFDRPGLGWSDDLGGPESLSPVSQADHLRAAAEELGVRRPIVLGHSYGAAVALAWGLRDPGQTSALVIVSGATRPWDGGLGPSYTLTASRFGRATIVPLASAFATEGLTRSVIESIFKPQSAPDGYPQYIGAGLTLRQPTLYLNARQITALHPYLVEMEKLYDQLPMPVEIVHGDRDLVVPLEIHGLPLADLIPDAEISIIADGGHMPHHTHSDRVLDAIDRAARRAGRR